MLRPRPARSTSPVVAQRMAVAAAANPRLQMDAGEAYEPSFTLLLAGVAAPTMIYYYDLILARSRLMRFRLFGAAPTIVIERERDP